jgi:hypothetical protein
MNQEELITKFWQRAERDRQFYEIRDLKEMLDRSGFKFAMSIYYITAPNVGGNPESHRIEIMMTEIPTSDMFWKIRTMFAEMVLPYKYALFSYNIKRDYWEMIKSYE